MSLLSRLTGLLRKQSPMLSVSVKLRAAKYFIVTIHGCDGSAPCISAGPVAVLPLTTSHEELGTAIVHALQQTTHNYPYPANQEQWSEVTAPLLSAAGCKSWGAFAKLASDLRVDQTAEHVCVLPCSREKTSFAPVPGREIHLTSPSVQELGATVASELAFAAQRDGA